MSQLRDVLAESKGNVETAHWVAAFAARVYKYAAQKGLTDINPALALRGGIQAVPTESHHGLTDPKEFGALMRAIDDYPKASAQCAETDCARVRAPR